MSKPPSSQPPPPPPRQPPPPQPPPRALPPQQPPPAQMLQGLPPQPGSVAQPASPPPQPPPKEKRGALTMVGLPYMEWTPLTVLFGVLTAIGIMLFGTFPIVLFDPELDSTAAKDVAQLMVGIALIGGALIFAMADAKGKLREALRRLGLRGLTWRVIGLGALAWGIYLLFALVLAPLLNPEQQDVTKEIGGDNGGALNIIIGGFLIVILAPLSEEIFFRGFMFAGLRRAMPLWPAAVISGAVWGSLHLSGGNIGVAIQLAIFGVVLAWFYERSGSLYATIFAHGLNNLIAFLYLLSI